MDLRTPYLRLQNLRYKDTPQRMRAYMHYRERDFTEPNWVRPSDFRTLELPRPVVLINGAFDILTAAHMRTIFVARKKAATLVLALDSDEKIRKEKGSARPILNFIERLTTLNYMPLDYTVEINNNTDFRELMRALRPDLRVQGMDYADHTTRFPETPRVLLREGSIHTSEIVRRVIERYAKAKPTEVTL